MVSVIFRAPYGLLLRLYNVLEHLTPLPLDKMAAILAHDIFNCIFLNENGRVLIQTSFKYAPMSPIDNKPALIQVMTSHRKGDKPLPGPKMTQFIDSCI